MSYKIHFYSLLFISTFLFTISIKSFAADAITFTLDNDLFIASDEGYTNGIYGSWYYIGRGKDQPNSSRLVWPLKWSMPDTDGELSINAYSIGQSMYTPSDILASNPDPDDIPYAGILFLSNTYIVSYGSFVDSITTTIGIIGPESGAESTQKFFHEITDSDQPQGWDYQLENEVIFKLTRGRMWRNWISENGNFDLLSGVDMGIGTLESAINAGVAIRVGQQLSTSYISGILTPSRTSNFIAVNNGWFAYLMIGGRLIANHIVLNGNTYRDSRSIDLDNTHVTLTSGLAYSWGDLSVTLAYSDISFKDENISTASRYGTLTVGWFFR
ncbi:MAG: lipid A deacylase LpxR family protein [Gammaproteobacteria bacterium]|nr:lipid A deacylase LpxR family protein [Gammaproteobacteria bacterium]